MERQRGYNWFIAFRQIHATAQGGHKWDWESLNKELLRISGTQILVIKFQGTFVFGKGRGRCSFQARSEASWNKISFATKIVHIFTLFPLRSKRNFDNRKNKISDKAHILKFKNHVSIILYSIIQHPPPQKKRTGRPQLKWSDRHNFQEGGTDHEWRLWWCYFQ